ELQVPGDAVGEVRAPAGEPADRVAAVVGAQRVRRSGPDGEAEVPVQELGAEQDLRALQAGHARGIGPDRRSVLGARAVSGRGEADVRGSDFVRADSTGQGL